jgi:pimeloyl-ACP methyl ester carboxylesterase
VTLLQGVRYVWVRLGVLALLAAPVAMFLVFRASGLPPDTFATTDALRVTESDGYVRFQPIAPVRAGLMLIPGCPVDPNAYGPLARSIALGGVLSVIVKVPFRCAPRAADQATLVQRVSGIIDSCRDCAWTLAGHSRGAGHALAVAGAADLGRIRSLALIGSTHPREENYSGLKIPVLRILATEDGVAPPAEAQTKSALLPPRTRVDVIQGGNHAQFAYYGYQPWDRPATISRAEQHARVAALLLSWVAGQP